MLLMSLASTEFSASSVPGGFWMAAPPQRVAEADVTCPSLLGPSIATERTFCDVLTGRDPNAGVLIEIPRHTGTATLSFDLHNRHTYSEEQVRTGQGYAGYTAMIGVVTLEGELLARGIVQSEFRDAGDLLDRVAGGAGPGGVKAVAPVGAERIFVSVPANIRQVSILGESLVVQRWDAKDEFTSPGRPIAIVSSIEVEFRRRR